MKELIVDARRFVACSESLLLSNREQDVQDERICRIKRVV
jgi:hypothetical protein